MVKLSIITAISNDLINFQETVHSLLQLKKNISFEYIVIDNESSDGTSNFIQHLGDLVSIYICEKDNGISDAWNKGIALSSGKYLHFLNAGDTVDSVHFSAYLSQVTDHDFYYSNLCWLSNPVQTFRPNQNYSQTVKYCMPFCHPTLLFKKSKLTQVGYYSLNYRFAMDYDLILRLFLNGSSGKYIPLTTVSMLPGGLHDTNYWETVNEVKTISTKYGASKFIAVLVMVYTYINHKIHTPVFIRRLLKFIFRLTKV